VTEELDKQIDAIAWSGFHLSLQKQLIESLIQRREIMSEKFKYYNCTIIQDRYGGAYSGGSFVAFGFSPSQVPAFVGDGDIEEASGWPEIAGTYGVGESPDEAFRDLERILTRASEEKS